jgi:hypothetical protein
MYPNLYTTEARRRELLSSVWPDMPDKHFPASFDGVTGAFRPKSAADMSKYGHWTWNYGLSWRCLGSSIEVTHG